MNMKTKILFERHYVEAGSEKLEPSKAAYYNAFLLSNFGIVVDRPELLTKKVLEDMSEYLHLSVPHSFYANPQDTNYFTCEELLVEQLVSYFAVECMGDGVFGDNSDSRFDRIEVFKKDLPEYVVGDELKLREFKVLTEADLDKVFVEITNAFCAYTRPFSIDELDEFVWLFENGYYKDEKIKCKDNIISLLKKDVSFARGLDKKDLVKLSVGAFGDKKELVINTASDEYKLIKAAMPLVHDCPLSKKQAKYFNKLCEMVGMKAVSDNSRSPYKKATALINEGKVYEAAKVYAANGSLLERNVKFLLSRANPVDALKILDMIPAKNPMALYQMVNTLSADNGAARTFAFYKNNKVHHHVETEYERKWRKSTLNEATRELLHDACFNKIVDSYKAMESLGKVYVSDEFYRIGVPTNTSASGKGLDVLPTGSRILIKSPYIRTFVRWKGIHDVDANVTAIREVNGKLSIANGDFMYFGNASSKPFGSSVCFSGDDRSNDGCEYYDVKLDEMKEKGYRYIVFSFHGFTSDFNHGECIAGYQCKENLNTRAWDPKNIELQFKVTGDTRACQAYAIDLETRELIMLNLMVNNESAVIDSSDTNGLAKFLSPSFLEFNVGLVVSNRGEVVNDPALADVVFDNSYMPAEGQKVVRSYDTEKLVALANGAILG